jgi:hypothetical protein
MPSAAIPNSTAFSRKGDDEGPLISAEVKRLVNGFFKLRPGTVHFLLSCRSRSISIEMRSDVTAKDQEALAQISHPPDTCVFPMVRNNARENPCFALIKFVCGFRFMQECLYHRVVIQESRRSHKHKVLLTYVGSGTELRICLLKRQTSEMLPCTNLIVASLSGAISSLLRDVIGMHPFQMLETNKFCHDLTG